MRAALAIVAVSLACAAAVRADDSSDVLAASKDYMARSDRFDPSVADLYADDAAIRSKRVTPDGRAHAQSFTGTQWKALIRQAIPVAKQRGDRNTFRNISAKPNGKDVIVTAERYSHLKAYTSPFAQFWRRNENGVWRISAEVTETRP